MTDYYKLLGISKQAKDAEIKSAYKKLALLFHPDKNRTREAESKFRAIHQAYSVLIDKERRKSYDRQLDNERKRFTKDYHYNFNNFSRPAWFTNKQYVQDPPIFHDLYVTLEEVEAGCTKHVKITKKIVQFNDIRKEGKILTLYIIPGCMPGRRITFAKEGSQNGNRIPADVIFIIKDKPHPVFERRAANLIHRAHLSPEQMKTLPVIRIPIHFGAKIEIQLTSDMIQKGLLLPYYGLPLEGRLNSRGHLFVYFNIGEGGHTVSTVSTSRTNQDPDIIHELRVTLEEIEKGCSKPMRITKEIFHSNGDVNMETKFLKVYVAPGCVTGTKLIFPEEGDQHVDRIPADIIFVVKITQHPHFEREGDNLIHRINISAIQANTVHFMLVPTLSQGTFPIKLTKETIEKGLLIPNLGLPSSKDLTKKGHLIVYFNVAKSDQTS